LGVLRLILAIAVFATHVRLVGESLPFPLLPAMHAVELFFIISGFYMALILNEKYAGPGSYKLFVTNRALRLYPPYWAVAAIAVGLWLTRHGAGPLAVGKYVGLPGVAFITAANAFIVGQDAVMFLGVNPNGSLFFSSNFWTTSPMLWTFLLVPQAWSLSLEIMFYALAPLLVRRSLSVVAAVIGASLAVRAFVYVGLGYRYDPWSYRFFPAELALFLAGAVAYRIYARLRSRPRRTAWLAVGGGLLVAMVLITPYMPAHSGLVRLAWQWGLYAVATATIPCLFLLTKSWRLDRYIGELSYPIYITHMLVLEFLPPALRRMGYGGRLWVICLAVTVVASVLLVHLVSAPVERFRQRRFERRTGRPPKIHGPVTGSISSPPPL
jgi:peptidoglycan/LPS O-acetylase OafA/YrhL